MSGEELAAEETPAPELSFDDAISWLDRQMRACLLIFHAPGLRPEPFD
jgi:hypothetical protein